MNNTTIKLLDGTIIKTIKQFEKHFGANPKALVLDKKNKSKPNKLIELNLEFYFEQDRERYFKKENDDWVEQKNYGKFIDDFGTIYFITKEFKTETANGNKIIIAETNRQTFLIILHNSKDNSQEAFHLIKETFFIFNALMSSFVGYQKDFEKEYLDFLKTYIGKKNIISTFDKQE
jgi:hypothetical protein